jgi:hypothetical protein
MSVQGKNQLSYKKKNVAEQNQPNVGVKNITFAHQATAGEEAIVYNALTTPASWLQSGHTQPSSQTLLSSNLQLFRDNCKVTSSVRGVIQKNEYVVRNSGIFFKTITSNLNEIFEVEFSDILVHGNLITDIKAIRSEGNLLPSTTDYNIGVTVNVLNEEVIVFRNGQQLFRNDANNNDNSGNYRYLDTDNDGYASVIRFNDPAGLNPEAILVVSAGGGYVDTPNLSTFQEINKLAAQIDAIVPTVAQLAGVPETDFQTAPNNVDMKAFGDLVLKMQKNFNLLLQKLDSDIGVNDTDYFSDLEV